jgi:hypothetical protein
MQKAANVRLVFFAQIDAPLLHYRGPVLIMQ